MDGEKKKNKINGQSGFFRLIILIVIAILLLIYFGDTVKQFLASDDTKLIFKKLILLVHYLWENYIKAPFHYVWDKVVVGILWEMIIKPALELLKNFKG